MSSTATSVRRTNPTGYATLTADDSEWGPARHDPEQPSHREAPGFLRTDLRDGDEARPDDN
ncbi:hypothetical protein KVF89_08605 [Nocardioides carbamazepini]|jgi:hypothetical protein|uniref:hypothetical protein n=1 Tax=Nocardioides carbamazepini TaxID=2854259 RepID=UPI00214A53C7|nr:hypothetical protein [Nocardioides carbamazepini]MCR1782590.1 hypothetical protein [Nocardioides carbamazepini]